MATIEELEAAVLAELQHEAESLDIDLTKETYEPLYSDIMLEDIAEFAAKYSQYPDARITCANQEWDGGIELRVCYRVPKTQKELLSDIVSARSRRERVEEYERRQLAELKKKYESVEGQS